MKDDPQRKDDDLDDPIWGADGRLDVTKVGERLVSTRRRLLRSIGCMP